MIAVPILSISIGAAIGALMRWALGLSMNHLFPTIPLGTLSANLIGGFLMGVLIALTKDARIYSRDHEISPFYGVFRVFNNIFNLLSRDY